MGRHIAFKQADVLRAVRGAKAGGFDVGRVEVEAATGKIILFAADEKKPAEDPFGKWLENRDARSA